jgi:hypothetical protein
MDMEGGSDFLMTLTQIPRPKKRTLYTLRMLWRIKRNKR